jgi:hypothetical protein
MDTEKVPFFSYPAEKPTFLAEKEPVQFPFFPFESGPGHSNELVALSERFYSILMFTPMHTCKILYTSRAVHRYRAKV